MLKCALVIAFSLFATLSGMEKDEALMERPLKRQRIDDVVITRSFEYLIYYVCSLEEYEVPGYIKSMDPSVKEELKKKVNTANPAGKTTFMQLLEDGNTAVALRMLTYFDADVTIKDKTGNTPLHIAAYCCPDAVPSILEKAKLHFQELAENDLYDENLPLFSDYINARGMDQCSPLLLACRFGGPAIPALLEAGANPNAEKHLISWAREIMTCTISSKDDYETYGDHGETPLIFASMNPKASSHIPLLIHKGADKNYRCDSGINALRYALIFGNFEATQELLTAGLRNIDTGKADQVKLAELVLKNFRKNRMKVIELLNKYELLGTPEKQ